VERDVRLRRRHQHLLSALHCRSYGRT
jgi:hypothetical protein